MSDADVCHGVLVGCRDLVAVVRRLMLCSIQLSVTSSVSADVTLSLLDDILVLRHCRISFVQCFDAVGWVTGRASSL